MPRTGARIQPEHFCSQAERGRRKGKEKYRFHQTSLHSSRSNVELQPQIPERLGPRSIQHWVTFRQELSATNSEDFPA